MTYVLDASMAATLILPDEEGESLRELIAALGEGDRLLVPPLWWYEMGNLLVSALRRGRLSEALAFRALEALRRLAPTVDPRPPEELTPTLFILASRHGLSLYDAAYLELAEREGATLCSRDEALRKAASASESGLVPPI